MFTECYLAWCELERRLKNEKGIDSLLETAIKAESLKWYNILKQTIDVVLFLGEKDLPQRIGDKSNGNFLGLI